MIHFPEPIDDGSDLKKNFQLSWLAPDVLSLVGSIAVQLVTFFYTTASVYVLLSSSRHCSISVLILDMLSVMIL